MELEPTIAAWDLGSSQTKATDFDALITEHGATETISALFERYGMDWSGFAADISSATALQASSRAIKTIGTYYHRLRHGGVENVLSQLCALWTTMGYKVVVFTREESHPDDYKLPETVERVVIPDPFVTGEVRTTAETLKNAIENYDLDVFVYHAWCFDYLIWDLLAVKSSAVPFLLYVHGSGSAMFVSPRLLKSLLPCYSLLDGAVTLGEFDKQLFESFCGKAWRILNPINPELQGVRQAPPAEKNVLWVGRLDKLQKRYLDLIPIMTRLVDLVPDARLTVVGTASSPEEFAAFQAMIYAAGLGDYIHLAGFKQDVNSYYKQAQVLINTSFYEGFPVTVIESMAHGLPVLMYDLRTLDIVREPCGVLTVPRFNTDAFAGKLALLLEDNRLRQQLSDAAHAAFARYTEVDHVAQWREIFIEAQCGNDGLDKDTFAKDLIGEMCDAYQWLQVKQEESHRQDLEDVRHSWSYKLGNFLLKPVRLISGRK
jgi:glycosyltransferase involved in cell wall biosynthesis